MFTKDQIVYQNIRSSAVDEQNHLLYSSNETQNSDLHTFPEQRQQPQPQEEEETETLLVKKKPFWRIVLRYLPVWIIVVCCWAVGLGLSLMDCSIPTSAFNCLYFYSVDGCEVIGYEFHSFYSTYFSYLRISFYNPRLQSRMNCSIPVNYMGVANITEETQSLQLIYPLHSLVNNVAIEESSNICLGLNYGYPAVNAVSISVFCAGLIFLVIGGWRLYLRKKLEAAKTLPLVSPSTAVVSVAPVITVLRNIGDRLLIQEGNEIDGGNIADEESPCSPDPLLMKQETMTSTRNELSFKPTFAVVQKP
jgi:hypothetical protein